MLNPQFIQIRTADELILPGLFYTSPSSKKVVIYLHGNGSSSVFYHDDLRNDYAEELLKQDISFLAFNNRGAHYVKKLDYSDESKGSKRFGMAYEIIKECVHDINGCVKFLQEKGFEKIYLAGESTGANKICVYDFYEKENPVDGYVLLAGGDDVGIYYQELGEKTFWRLLEESKKKVVEGKGEDIIIELLPTFFSYQGFYDIANPDGDYNVFPFFEAINDVQLSKKQPLFTMYKSLKKPTLTVYGEKDQYAWGDVNRVVDILRQQNSKPTYAVIRDADHVFNGHQREVGSMMTEWISSLS